jgi:acyl-CoA synthetase (AMP-forming)/AMP-acid ligase II
MPHPETLMPQDAPEPIPFTLEFQAFHNSEKIAAVDGDRRVSFRDLNAHVNRVANALSGLGIGRGDRVAVLLHNRGEWAEVIFAMGKLKASSVPVGYRLKGPEVEYILNNSEAKAMILGEEFLDVIVPLRERFEHVPKENFIVIGDRVPPGFRRYADLLAGASDAEPATNPEESASSIIYTSGTTGTPKGAYRAVQPRDVETLMDIIGQFGFSMDDTHLVSCPLYHSAPPFFAYVHLIFGATVVVSRQFDAEQFLATVERERVTTAFVVPTQLNRIANLPDAVKRKYDVSSMRALITGAAPCHHSTKVKTIELFGDGCFYEFYGATETGINTILRPEEQLVRLGSCGRAVAGNDIRIVGEDGKEVPTGEVGELYVKNSMLITGYFKNEKATRESLLDGYFSVGDMARVDAEGYVYIVDRKKDMVISGGVNIYPVEIEIALRAHPAVFDCAVFGVPDEEWGESLKAVVALKPEAEATADALLDFCRERLAGYKVPRSVDFVDEIPYNPSGKPLKRELRARYWEGVERRI